MRVAVVHWGEAGEALLACRVPDLEFDCSVGELAFLGEEGGADGGFFVGLELVVDESEDERGLFGQSSAYRYSGLHLHLGDAHLADGRFTEEDQLDAAARLGRRAVRVGHAGG